MPTEPRRIDMHCHSDASNKSSEAILNALNCPESYSRPEEVYRQARLRGMDFVTLTDHDTISGAQTLSHKPDVLVGEELTCWFPEDHCKMHVLVYGLDAALHAELQARSQNIYDVAELIEREQIAHSVAHPIYRQNDKLERWHLERLILMFKGFECLNGAHSALHREAFEPMLDSLTPAEIQRLHETHHIAPRWPEPWVKGRTGGSDDHGLLSVGRTWTEFPPDTQCPADVLKYLRIGLCQPGGEAGSSAKLAHTFYSVGVRYYSRHVTASSQSPNLATILLQKIAGQQTQLGKRQLLTLAVKHKIALITKNITRRNAAEGAPAKAGTGLLKRAFLSSARRRFDEQPRLKAALNSPLPVLGEHDAMFDLISGINRDVTQTLATAFLDNVGSGSFVALFDTVGALLAQQCLMLPYYFATFHQNKERHLLRKITGRQKPVNAGNLRVGVFTDTFDECNGVSRFLNDLAKQTVSSRRALVIHTCSTSPVRWDDNGVRKNFVPTLARTMPYYPDLPLVVPPLLDILEWSDRQQFDAIHVSTPGPMGLCGWVVSKMLRVPLVATYHTDFPAYLERLAGDHRLVNGTTQYMKWFYGQASTVLTRSNAYRFSLRDLGVADEKIQTLTAGIDLTRFHPPTRVTAQESQVTTGVREPRKLLYVGRISAEKNLPLLAATFTELCRRRRDAGLLFAGHGPYLESLKGALKGLPAYFLGQCDDDALADLYGSCDLLVFPSRTDTLGQAVMEAQACRLPALVSNEGGPKETVEHNVTGLVLAATDACEWATAIEDLLNDEPRRRRMSRAAAARMSGYGYAASFEQFWTAHLPPADQVNDSVETPTLDPVETPTAPI